jgi:hypothetical protein
MGDEMRKKLFFALACTLLTLGGLQAKHGHDDDCDHDRHYRGHYRHKADRDHDDHEPVPASVCRRLPPPPEDAVRGYYGGHVIVYNPHSSVILNVFAGISLSH